MRRLQDVGVESRCCKASDERSFGRFFDIARQQDAPARVVERDHQSEFLVFTSSSDRPKYSLVRKRAERRENRVANPDRMRQLARYSGFTGCLGEANRAGLRSRLAVRPQSPDRKVFHDEGEPIGVIRMRMGQDHTESMRWIPRRHRRAR